VQIVRCHMTACPKQDVVHHRVRCLKLICPQRQKLLRGRDRMRKHVAYVLFLLKVVRKLRLRNTYSSGKTQAFVVCGKDTVSVRPQYCVLFQFHVGLQGMRYVCAVYFLCSARVSFLTLGMGQKIHKGRISQGGLQVCE